MNVSFNLHPPARPNVYSIVGDESEAYFAFYNHWLDASTDARQIELSTSLAAAVLPLTGGAYVGESRVLQKSKEGFARCFSPEHLGFLRSVRAKYGADGVFFKLDL